MIPEFRVWSIKDQKMYDVCEVTKYTNGDYQAGISGTCWRVWVSGVNKEAELLQYSEIMDKNNIKIFQGDILIADNEMVVVIFANGQFGYWTSYGTFCSPSERDEVIGNRFANPELLKQRSVKLEKDENYSKIISKRATKEQRPLCIDCRNIFYYPLDNPDRIYYSCNGVTKTVDSVEPLGKKCYRKG